jgi:AcrR family transcriptional regulator
MILTGQYPCYLFARRPSEAQADAYLLTRRASEAQQEDCMRTANPERRERIINAAARLFGERHFHQVLLDDIAARAGVSKGTLYLYFKDKDDLYLALILHGKQRLFEQVQQTIRGLQSPEEKLLGLVSKMLEFCAEAPYFRELIQRAETSQSAVQTTALHQSRAQFLNLLIEIIDELNASERWAVADPELAALALMGMMREVIRWRKTTPDLPEKIVRLFLHGIRRDGATE